MKMGPTERVVVLIDMDCFYCQVEEKLNPELKDKPIAVVQYNAWRGGGIIAVNYPARDEGVTRHMRGNDAKKKCPSIQLVTVPELRGKADLTKYRDAGKEVADVLATFTPLLQRASVDEAYLDITEAVEKRISLGLDQLTVDNLSNTFVVGCELKDFIANAISNREFSIDNLKLAVGALITEEIRREVFIKTGYKCSAGIAHNKILAKLVCSLHKPNKQTVLPQTEVRKFFETMPINKIKNLGGKFGQNVSNDFQITYMGELAKISEKELAQKYDEKTAKWLHNISRGIDLEPVTTKLVPKSIACCKNFQAITALITAESIQQWLLKLSQEIAERLDKDLKENNRKAKQIIVSFAQEINHKDISSTRTISLNSYDPNKIAQSAFAVIEKNCKRKDGSYRVKYLGLNASNFEEVKKVKEITSFFQSGQNSSCKKPKECDTNENLDSKENDQSVYDQLTQELEEDTENIVFYDPEKSNDSATEIENSNNILNDSNSRNTTKQTCKTPDVKMSPSTSFFSRYFIKSNENTSNKETKSPKQETVDKDSNEEATEICDQCHESILVSEKISHYDYHFAMKLSKESAPKPEIIKTTVTVSPKKRQKLKRKIEEKNVLTEFFKKENLTNINTETCIECNKRIRVEDMSDHRDYHTAKRIHLEINAIKSLKPTNPPKTKNKSKNTPTNRSVISFFKPS